MRSRLMANTTILLGLVFSMTAYGQAKTKQPAAPKAAAKFDPRDFTGYWEGPGPRERPAEDARPEFTPAGKAAQAKRMPIYISKEPQDKDKENPGCRSSTCSNDPIHACNPVGFPR